MPLLQYRTYPFFVNETFKVQDPDRRHHHEIQIARPYKPMPLSTVSLAKNVEAYALPFKNMAAKARLRSQTPFYPPGTIVNRQLTILEKREEYMREFFENVQIEFRITIGEQWDDYLAKSTAQDIHLLKDLTAGKHFERNSEVNQFRNILMYTDAMKRFNLRINVGLTMGNEISEQDSAFILPYVQQLDDFQNIYA